MNAGKKAVILCVFLSMLAAPAAIAECTYGFANCWHCVRNTCWSSANQVSYWGDLWSYYCNLNFSGGCGAGECDLMYLEVTSICDGTYYGAWDYVCCDIA